MKIIVVGAGLLGVTSAYALSQRGHDVEVLERSTGPGRGASFANGALLTPSMCEPWNAPGCWRTLLGSLWRSDSPLQLRARALPGLLGWGYTFLRNSIPARYECAAAANLRLALHSAQVMQALRERTGIDYGRAAVGSMKVFRSATSFARARALTKIHATHGFDVRALNPAEAAVLEPALESIADQLEGAIYFGMDEVGDAFKFCNALAELSTREGVRYRFGAEAVALEKRRNKTALVLQDGQILSTDRYVIAAGSVTAPLLRTIGIRLPIQPVKGYSLTLGADAIDQRQPPLRTPIIDDDRHAVVVPVNNAIRVAGNAEFAGSDLAITQENVRRLICLLQGVLPNSIIDSARGASWCGLRPMSVDGVPIIGPTPASDVFVNSGHGHLGWTLAAASSQLLAELISEQAPTLDPAAFTFKRFRH